MVISTCRSFPFFPSVFLYLSSLSVKVMQSMRHWTIPVSLSLGKGHSREFYVYHLISDRATYWAIFVHPFRYWRFTIQFAVEGAPEGIRFVPLRESPRKFALVIGPRRTGNDSRGSNACSFPSRVPPPPNRFLDEVDENGLGEYFTLGTEVPRRSSSLRYRTHYYTKYR